ncbi:MAG TPA: DUF3048 domain-containing protein [Chloroflexi bacterium]|nr:DUF3048 domain-containing protein [Chloroflexota bacterium]
MATLKKAFALFLVVTLLAGCAPGNPGSTTPTIEATDTSVPPTATITPTVTEIPPTPTPTVTPTPEPVVFGPADFPEGVNPLTGLEVEDPDILDRRPVIVKVQNLPRTDRPQFGLSLADLVYEYYTEQGTTRFTAIYYGQDAELVAPIRSARFFDIHINEMYKGVFVFGGAYYLLLNRLMESDFADKLIIEADRWLPAVRRFDPGARNYLSVDTAALQEVLEKNNVDNTRPNLDGMLFSPEVPDGGEDGSQVIARFSAAIYNRWDYDPETGRYLRFSDTENDITGGENEVYEQLTDALTEQPIAADNVVIVLVRYEIRDPRADAEVLDMQLLGQGPAYIARDGKLYEVQWQRLNRDSVLTLVDAEGNPFPFKPGQTWFEIMAANTTVTSTDTDDDGKLLWRFDFHSDW